MRALQIFGLMLVVATAAACEGRSACHVGDYEHCACDGGKGGYRRCVDAEAGYGTCDCSGEIVGLTTSVGSGGAGGAGGSGGSGGVPKLPFLAACTTDEQCDSGLCFHFNTKGPHCSKPCATSADCPSPSPGCSGMGVCKVP